MACGLGDSISYENLVSRVLRAQVDKSSQFTDWARRPLSQQELAVRLAYFLWGAPPDARLRELASHGELSQPEVLAAETDRLLDDPRAAGFTPKTPVIEITGVCSHCRQAA